MSLVNQTFDCESLLLSPNVFARCVGLSKELNWFSWLAIQFEKEHDKFLLCWVLEAAYQVETLRGVVIAQCLLKLHVKAARSERGINLHLLSYKLFRKLRDILCKPAVEGDSLHVLRSAEDNNAICLGLDWAVRNSNWDEDFACLRVDQSQKGL